MLGVFDSGLGGLTVVRRLRERLPSEDIVFLADQAHVPYGDRTTDDLSRLLRQNVASLVAANVDAVVMGCNTSCAVAAERGWPPAPVPILDLIAAAADAVAATGATRVGVLATVATIRSGAYGAAIRARVPRTEVVEVAAPRLVPLVESGIVAGPVARAAVSEALAPFGGPLDALVLACTHYPLLDREFAAVLGSRVARVDPAFAQAERATAFAARRGGTGGSGITRFLTTGEPAAFRRSLAALAVEIGPNDTVETVAPGATTAVERRLRA